MKLEQKARIYGIIGALLFQVALFLLLWFWVLPHVSPEEEQGLSVALGVDAEGGNDFFEPAPAEEIEGALAAMEPEPLASGIDEFQTQDIEESVAMPGAKKEKTQEELRREQEQRQQQYLREQERQEELRKAAEAKALKEAQDRKVEEIGNRTRNLFGGGGTGGSGNSNSSSGQGTGQSTGNQGNPFGSPDATNKEGSGSGSGGNSYSLAGRSLAGSLIKPTYNVYEEGKIVVTIIVDKEGTVISAVVGSGTNIDNPTLRSAALDAAKRTKFNKISTEKNQSGTITYNFKLQ